MISKSFLASVGVKVGAWPDRPDKKLKPVVGVFCTMSNQIVGSFSDLKKFRDANEDYRGWHRHHVVESRDLERLDIANRLPETDQQLCVLLPPDAHAVRINSVLQRQSPNHVFVNVNELKGAYALAYSTMGDYCGGGEEAIRQELLAIVRGTFRSVGIL
jgi:hypothetical protein